MSKKIKKIETSSIVLKGIIFFAGCALLTDLGVTYSKIPILASIFLGVLGIAFVIMSIFSLKGKNI